MFNQPISPTLQRRASAQNNLARSPGATTQAPGYVRQPLQTTTALAHGASDRELNRISEEFDRAMSDPNALTDETIQSLMQRILGSEELPTSILDAAALVYVDGCQDLERLRALRDLIHDEARANAGAPLPQQMPLIAATQPQGIGAGAAPYGFEEAVQHLVDIEFNAALSDETKRTALGHAMDILENKGDMAEIMRFVNDVKAGSTGAAGLVTDVPVSNASGPALENPPIDQPAHPGQGNPSAPNHLPNAFAIPPASRPPRNPDLTFETRRSMETMLANPLAPRRQQLANLMAANPEITQSAANRRFRVGVEEMALGASPATREQVLAALRVGKKSREGFVNSVSQRLRGVPINAVAIGAFYDAMQFYKGQNIPRSTVSWENLLAVVPPEHRDIASAFVNKPLGYSTMGPVSPGGVQPKAVANANANANATPHPMPVPLNQQIAQAATTPRAANPTPNPAPVSTSTFSRSADVASPPAKRARMSGPRDQPQAHPAMANAFPSSVSTPGSLASPQVGPVVTQPSAQQPAAMPMQPPMPTGDAVTVSPVANPRNTPPSHP